MGKISLLLMLTLLLVSTGSIPLQSNRAADHNVSADEDQSNSVALTVIGVGLLACAVTLVAVCTCCGDEVLTSHKRMSNDYGTQRTESFAPPGESTPATPDGDRRDELAVTIEPLPDIGRTRNDKSELPKPMGYNHAVNKGASSDEWMKADCKIPDFQRNQLQYVKQIDTGWFGQVIEGEAGRLDAAVRKTKVIVKMLKDDASTMERSYFLSECNMFRDLSHVNLLTLRAKCLDTQSYLLIFEYANTDLKEFLMNNRGKSEALISCGTLMSYVCQTAQALAYLHDHQYVHGDIACRNCLVFNGTTVKLGDYGLSPQKYKEDYLIAGNLAVPVRWLAPEMAEISADGRLVTRDMTASANIWSFGVFMWEVLEFAKLPYMDLSTEQVVDMVIKERTNRLTQPFTPVPRRDNLFEIMKMCWLSSSMRPPMSKIRDVLIYIHDHRDIPETEGDFDARWNSLQAPPHQPKNASPTPVPSDPVMRTLVVEAQAPTKAAARLPEEPKPPIFAEAPMQVSTQAVVETAPPPLKEVGLDVAASPPVGRSAEELASFQESERERREKREFILSLSDEDLAALSQTEVADFYEFLDMAEIKTLATRHEAVLKRLADAKFEADQLSLRLEAEHQAKLEAERLEAERLERELAERQARDQAELEAKAEVERLEKERREREERERQESERLEFQKQEELRLQKEAEELAAQKEIERIENERLEKEELDRQEAVRLEAELLESQRQEELGMQKEAEEREARIAAEMQEKERLEREELERQEATRLEAERIEAQKQEELRLQKEAEEKEARIEAERLEKKRVEREELERQEAVRLEQERLELQRKEEERVLIEAQEKAEKEKLERERLEYEETERKEKEEQELLKLEQEKLEAERLAKEEHDRMRDTILTADGIELFNLHREGQGLDPYYKHLDDEEIMTVTQRLEDVRKMRDSLLQDETVPDLADDQLRRWLNEEEIGVIVGKRSEASAEEKRIELLRKEILDSDKLALMRLYKTRWDNFWPFLSVEERAGIQNKVLKTKEKIELLRSMHKNDLCQVSGEELNHLEEYMEPEDFSKLKDQWEDAVCHRREMRDRILTCPDEELARIADQDGFGMYQPFLTQDEFLAVTERLESSTRHSKPINLPVNESAAAQNNLELLSHAIPDEQGHIVSPIPAVRVSKLKDEEQTDAEKKSTSTPDTELQPEKRLKTRRSAAGGLPSLSFDKDPGDNSLALVDGEPFEAPLSTPAAKKVFDDSRSFILSLNDEELRRVPIGEIESNYQYLTATEILAMKERLRHLQQIQDDWTMESASVIDQSSLASSTAPSALDRSMLETSAGTLKPKRRPLMSELSVQSKSFLSTMSSFGGAGSDCGFIDDSIGVGFVFDDGGYIDDAMPKFGAFGLREKLIYAEDDFLLETPLEKIQEGYNVLTCEEIQDLQGRILESRQFKRAELLGMTPTELRQTVSAESLERYAVWLTPQDLKTLKDRLAEQSPLADELGSLDMNVTPDHQLLQAEFQDFLRTTPKLESSASVTESFAFESIVSDGAQADISSEVSSGEQPQPHPSAATPSPPPQQLAVDATPYQTPVEAVDTLHNPNYDMMTHSEADWSMSTEGAYCTPLATSSNTPSGVHILEEESTPAVAPGTVENLNYDNLHLEEKIIRSDVKDAPPPILNLNESHPSLEAVEDLNSKTVTLTTKTVEVRRGSATPGSGDLLAAGFSDDLLGSADLLGDIGSAIKTETTTRTFTSTTTFNAPAEESFFDSDRSLTAAESGQSPTKERSASIDELLS